MLSRTFEDGPPSRVDCLRMEHFTHHIFVNSTRRRSVRSTLVCKGVPDIIRSTIRTVEDKNCLFLKIDCTVVKHHDRCRPLFHPSFRDGATHPKNHTADTVRYVLEALSSHTTPPVPYPTVRYRPKAHAMSTPRPSLLLQQTKAMADLPPLTPPLPDYPYLSPLCFSKGAVLKAGLWEPYVVFDRTMKDKVEEYVPLATFDNDPDGADITPLWESGTL